MLQILWRRHAWHQKHSLFFNTIRILCDHQTLAFLKTLNHQSLAPTIDFSITFRVLHIYNNAWIFQSLTIPWQRKLLSKDRLADAHDTCLLLFDRQTGQPFQSEIFLSIKMFCLQNERSSLIGSTQCERNPTNWM